MTFETYAGDLCIIRAMSPCVMSGNFIFKARSSSAFVISEGGFVSGASVSFAYTVNAICSK